MLMTIDVGNTNITVGIFDKQKLVGNFRLTTGMTRTSDEFGTAIGEILRYNVSGTGDSEIPFTTMLLDGKPMYLYVMWPDEEDVAVGIEMLRAMHRDEMIQLPEERACHLRTYCGMVRKTNRM